MGQFTDMMLDIETFGTGNNAAIVSIGAVMFNADSDDNAALFTNSPELIERDGLGFHGRVDLGETAPNMRGVIDPQTVEWWLQQSDEARKALVEGERKPLGTVLADFARWIDGWGKANKVRMWSNGPTFDEVIVRSAFDRYGLRMPIHFRGSRCCRTMFELAVLFGWQRSEAVARVHGNDPLLKHDALADAVFQARGVVLQRAHLRQRLGVRAAIEAGGGL